MNRQFIDTCEKFRKCTLFGKNPKPTNAFNTAIYLPSLSGPNQELQLEFAGPLSDEKDNKIYLLVAIDSFSKFPRVNLKINKILSSYIRIHSIPQFIRIDHGSGFNIDVVKQFCFNRGIVHILTPVGDHWANGLVERSIQTIKRKLGTEKRDPNFNNLKSTIQQIVENIRKSKHSVLKKSPFEMHFGRKPNTEWSQVLNNVIKNATSTQGLECNLLTPDQIASQAYSQNYSRQ